jgi:hypothetical protein
VDLLNWLVVFSELHHRNLHGNYQHIHVMLKVESMVEAEELSTDKHKKRWLPSVVGETWLGRGQYMYFSC